MLTKTGWPRPIVRGLPIPWVSPSDDLSSMHPARAAACASGAICAVCGEGYADGEQAFTLVTAAEPPADMASVEVRAMDNGILHKRCLQLALAVCPKLKTLTVEGMLQIVATRGNIAQVTIEEGGEVKAVLDGSDCVPVDRYALKGV